MTEASEEKGAAQAALASGDVEQARRRIDRAVELLSDAESPEERRLLADCLVVMANVFSLEGNFGGRLEANRRSRDLYESLSDPSVELALANVEGNIGHDLLQRDSSEAQRLLLSAIERFSRHVSWQPEPSQEAEGIPHFSPEFGLVYRVGYGKALYHLAMIYQSYQDERRASNEYRLAELVFCSLEATVKHRRLAASAAQNLCVVLERCYLLVNSVAAGERARTLYAGLVREGHWQFYGPLAETLVNLSMSHYYAQDLEQAGRCGRQAIAMLEDLVGSWRLQRYQHLLSSISYNLQSMGQVVHGYGATPELLGLWKSYREGCENDFTALSAKLESFSRESFSALFLCEIAGNESPERAIPLYERAHQSFEQFLGEGRFDLFAASARQLCQRGCAHQRLGQHELAIPLLQSGVERYLELNEGGRGDVPWDISCYRQALAASYLALDRLANARKTYQQALEVFQVYLTLGPADAERAQPHIDEIEAVLSNQDMLRTGL